MKPKIIILGTGGTIAAESSSGVDEHYHLSNIPVSNIVKNIPELKKIAAFKCVQFSNVISNEIDDTLLIKLAGKVHSLLKQKNISGVVVTHGTNTIEETAYFLNLVVRNTKPIILTGAMRPKSNLTADGAINLYNAVVLAANPGAHKKGVLVTFNGMIVNAREAVKCSVDAINDFAHPELGVLGNIQGNKVYFYRAAVTRHTFKSEFKLPKLNNFPKVHIIYAYSGCDTVQVDAAISDGVKGIVCVGMGKGYFPKAMLSLLIKARENNVHIVRCSRVTGGVVTVDPKLDEKFGFIAGNNLSPQKARILLSMALSKTNHQNDIQRIFDEY